MSITLDTGQIFTALAAIVGGVTGSIVTARKIVKPLLIMAKDWREFRGDWYGVPDREGFPGHAGMGVRMRDAEAYIEESRDDMRMIKLELVTNGGSSLKDALKRIEEQGRVSAIHSGAPLAALPLPNHQAEGIAA